MGKFFKPSTTTTKQPFETDPWKPQQGSLKAGFQAGEDALNKGLDNNAGITDYTADLNGQQTAAANGMFNTGMGTGQSVGGQMVQTGQDLAGNLNNYASNAQQMFGASTADRTAMVRDQGIAMADNPFIQGQIDAVSRDANQMLDLQSADVNSGASGTGNINSTRAGVLDSLNQQAAADRVATSSAQIRGAAFDNGMGLANDVDSRVSGERMRANDAIGAVGAQGFDLMRGGYDQMSQGYGDALSGGSVFQQQAQNEINGQREMSQADMDLVSKYMQTVGGNYGQSGFTTSTQQAASPFQQVVGGVATIAGLAKKGATGGAG